ncbi:hypothetical protein EC957_001280, partial [Mortierella hygrophila]
MEASFHRQAPSGASPYHVKNKLYVAVKAINLYVLQPWAGYTFCLMQDVGGAIRRDFG